MTAISILGGGPAGSAAAISAIGAGVACSIVEKSRFPRHKVCGEFFSPEIQAELVNLGAWDAFRAAGPAPVRHMRLCFGKREKIARLPETAWGLSRYAFDLLMLERARELGARVEPSAHEARASVIACGRRLDDSPRGSRLFGFKGHFTGPTEDAVELFFFGRCYVGIAPVEHGRTNVCGLGPEDFLRRFDFDYDAVIRESPALAERMRPLARSIDWLSTGPLKYGQSFGQSSAYLAGDALSFVDPFTGSGLVAAVKTGALAGVAAARGEPVATYIRRCRAALRRPFEVSSVFRKAIQGGLAERLVGLVPGRALFALTRPK
ncbi:MAG TPA: hypothetical protein VMG40_15190 [Bryobacteraceae bacterium]|nr:hypothetical protein [Bryobacteraceae bacterium]